MDGGLRALRLEAGGLGDGLARADDPLLLWATMVLFEGVADRYDAVRPSYPSQWYDHLGALVGGLEGRDVLDVGAGTGIATRQLLERGALVTAVDAGIEMLKRAARSTPALAAVNADGAVCPFRGEIFGVVCFAQSWHWIDQASGAAEAARILRPGGYWAAWWNHPWADGQDWFEECWALIEARCAGASRRQREVDWCRDAIAAQGDFAEPERHSVGWERVVGIDDWMADLRRHSYIVALSVQDRERLLGEIDTVLGHGFPTGRMRVRYETRAWTARRL